MKPSLRNTLTVALLCLLGAVGGYWTARLWLPGTHNTAQSAPAPAITFTEISGKPLALSDLRGKLVLVNFWATWCAPCMDELPLLVKAQKQFGSRGLQVVGPAMDDAD
ncbi:MAG: TlpA family protein disulfide reductase, partial [Stenotrophobium sp.]